MFFKSSRYANVGEHQLTQAGRVIRYKKIRFIPETPANRTYRVREKERLDQVAHKYFRDPEKFWAICDANQAMEPAAVLSQPGKVILIPPEA